MAPQLDAVSHDSQRRARARTAAVAPRAGEPWPRKTVAVACWLYLVCALSLWLFLRSEGDHRWIATLILFGPRWVALTPLLLLLPAALIRRRRSLLALLAASGLILFPVMGLCVPWRAAVSRSSAAGEGFSLRVLTCNIHRTDLDADAFAEVIASTHPDVVALQDWTSKYDAIFPAAKGWYILREYELCLVSRYPIRKVRDVGAENWDYRKLPGAAVCFELALPQGPVNFVNLHLASPHRAFEGALHRGSESRLQIEQNSEGRLRQSQAIGRFARESGAGTLLAGDFNTLQESELFVRSWTPFADAFATAGFGWGYTYHARWTAVRIDHILSGRAWRCRRSWVGPDVGSPHRPLIADLEWVGTSPER
jgi:endonuclease/exonuclease/phosphatase family metal-dependent hydrolase